ncbi:MAG: cobalamin-dependent protein, partial [Victivallales bacterium]
MAKVLLVYVNSFMDNLVPIGVSLLSACLKDAGHSVTLFDTTFYRTAEKTGDEARVESLQVRAVNLADYGILEKGVQLEEGFRNAIKSSAPDFIALSVVETTWFIAERLLAVCREMKVISIVGGVHATMDADAILDGGYSDYVCVGEGEGAIVDFASCIQEGKDCSGIRNIWTIREGKIVKNPLRPLVDLNSLPDQDWSIYEKERFYKPMGGWAWVCGPVELDRGCAFKCSFCCNARLHEMYKQHGRYSRERSVSKFISELKDKISKYKLQYVYIVSENFLQMNDARLEEFLSSYSSIGLPFWIETRPETVTADKLKKLKAVGCEGISIGVEHGNDGFRRKHLNRFIKDDII